MFKRMPTLCLKLSRPQAPAMLFQFRYTPWVPKGTPSDSSFSCGAWGGGGGVVPGRDAGGGGGGGGGALPSPLHTNHHKMLISPPSHFEKP